MAKDWTDEITASSGLPSDAFTFTDGSNYGLDGFQFEDEENEGVLRGVRLPEVSGFSQLPDGIITNPTPDPSDEVSLEDIEDGVNLASFIEETEIEDPSVDKTAFLSDLDWLDPTQEQDPDRLPENPINIKPELIEAWGLHRRTDGIRLIPNKDRETLQYEESLSHEDVSGLPQTKEAKQQVIDAAHWAMRMADNQMPLPEIKEGLVSRLGHMARMTRKLVSQLNDDKGLSGNVFVRSVAYPDIHKTARCGPIKKHLRKLGARYVVVPAGEQRLAVWESIGLKPVTKVPWKKALAHYKPKLVAQRYRVASEGEPREILRNAFLSEPQPAENFDVRPKHVSPSETVSLQEAIRGWRTADAVPAQVLDNSSRAEEEKRKKALVQISRWVKAGFISERDAQRLVSSSVSADMMIRTATLMVQKAFETSSDVPYEGVGTQLSDAPRNTSETSDGGGTRLLDTKVASVVKWVRTKMSEGAVGDELDVMLKARFSKTMLKAAKSALEATRDEHEGLSGHVYIDAEAYASEGGVDGCKKGALIHRANGLKAVMAMDRCGGCTLQNSDGYCSLYNKPLVDSPPVRDPEIYQQNAIKAANSPDYSATASLFAPAYDESEYSLVEPSQEIDFDDSVEPQSLGDVLWGDGMEIDL